MSNNNSNSEATSSPEDTENVISPPTIENSNDSITLSSREGNTSSITVIVSTALNNNINVPQNSPRISILRPPDYATIVDLINDPNNLPKLINRTQNVHIHISPPSGQTTVIHGPPPLDGAPPTYSAIMRIGSNDTGMTRDRRTVRMQPSPPFIAPRPPPSYAETQGIYTRNLQRNVLDEYVFTDEPIRLVCPMCSRMITTSIYTHRSNLTHFSALILFVCGCWPCCFIPYCMKSCKTTHHYCPDCETYLGMYTPW